MQLDGELEKLLEKIEAHSRKKEEDACNPCYASLSADSAGRLLPETVARGENRTIFARDRDRILYSKAFFRLAGKTQVFMSPRNPLISNRMTHTMHVAQLSRAIARALDLNEDLAEAIALGHDAGHPPFGHRGEKVLDELCRESLSGGFAHNTHSLRMLDVLEKRGKGLNLTYEVRDGIARHCGESESGRFTPGQPSKPEDLHNLADAEPSTLEGCVVKLCDRIAYVGKDIEDATASGIIKEEDIPEKITSVLGKTNGEIIDTLVRDLITNFYQDREEFRNKNGREPAKTEMSVRLSEGVTRALNSLIMDFNYPLIYESEVNNTYTVQTENMIRFLFKALLKEVEEMRVPASSQASLSAFGGDDEEFTKMMLGELGKLSASADSKAEARTFIIKENLRLFKGSKSSILFHLEQMDEEYWLGTRNAQIVVDYITFMTDEMARAVYEHLTIPKPVV